MLADRVPPLVCEDHVTAAPRARLRQTRAAPPTSRTGGRRMSYAVVTLPGSTFCVNVEVAVNALDVA